MQLYAVTADPEGPWHTPSHREGWCEVPQPAPPPPGTPVLCVGDLGCYGAVAERLAWRRFGEGLRGAGCQPLALMPCPARYWDPGTAGLYRQVVWDRARRLPCRLSGRIAPPYASLAGTARTDAAPDASQDPGAERLLDLLAPAVRLEPALLRALRCRLPGMDIGVEMAAWLHPDLAPKELGGEWQGGGTLERRFRGNRTRPMDERLLAAGLLRAMHGYLLPSLRHREGTNLARLLGEDDGGAGDYLADTVLTLQQGYGERSQRIRRYVLALAEQLPPEAWQDERLVALWVSANRERLRQRTATLPPGLDGLAAADWVLAGSAEPAERVLVQRGAALYLAEQWPSAGSGPAAGSPLARLMVTDAPVELSEPADAQGGTGAVGLQTFPPRPDQGVPIRPAGLILNAYDAELTIAPMTRPAWAQAIGQDADGLFVDIAEGSGTRRLRWVPPGLGEARPGALALQFPGAFWDQADALRWLSGETPSAPWATRTGVDDLGLWAEFSVKQVTQRMRWIWPGEFWMGTPEDEPGRVAHEDRHRVMLTRGYWLADTACTQALWQAVMGQNPSRFKGPERPVELVSWEEVQQFLQRVGAQVPGLDPRLPSEAEWENACRAGTETPFSFGPTIGTDQVNYNGNHFYQVNYNGNYSYAGVEKGVARTETVDVMALPANDWGLYQMHGNVLECCQDWYGAYLGDPSIDPAGTEVGDHRVCRGGCWGFVAVACRSGERLQWPPGDRLGDQGFRLARGPSNRAAGPQLASQGQEAPGGRDAGQTKRSGVGRVTGMLVG